MGIASLSVGPISARMVGELSKPPRGKDYLPVASQFFGMRFSV
jgi:hypothetical protein